MTTIVAPPWEEQPTAGGIVAASALPLPDVWIPFNDSLNMLAGYGTDIKVGTDVVARKVDFTRASTATYINKSGVLSTAAINEPRFEKDGLLLEGQSTNLITTSATLATSTVTVAAGSYTLSFYGTGSVTLSGAATGKLTGTATVKRVSLTVTTTAGVLTLTVAGTCSSAQLEALPFATSYIPTNGAAATRAMDSCSVNGINLPWGGAYDGISSFTMSITSNTLGVSGDGVGNIVTIGATDSYNGLRYKTVGGNSTGILVEGIPTSSVSTPDFSKQVTISAVVARASTTLCVNGVTLNATGSLTQPSYNKLTFGSGANRIIYGHIRNFRIWHSALTNEQIKALK